jgi:uncharacterized protein (DUF362 family)/Pyruvate/2-oxoacid:ferredoxin oxidoreductase delta subunit
MNKRVAVLECRAYDPELILGKMREAVTLTGGNDALDVKGKKVLLKPNVLFDAEVSKAVSTHPEFLRAAVQLMKELGASEIFVGDSPGFQKPGFKGRKCGLWEICQDEGVQWYDFSAGTVVKKCPDGKKVKQFQVSNITDKVDTIISLPKMKTHQLMYFTGAIKNQFGLLPGLSKSPYHMMFPGRQSFAEMVVDLHSAIEPAFAFMDGIIAMEGPGPGSGYPVDAGLILASPNLLALDITACRIIGYDPDIIPINRAAIDRGLWLERTSDPELVGITLEEAKLEGFEKIRLTGSRSQLLEFLTPSFIRKIETALAPRPIFHPPKCVRCGECVKICPADALSMKEMPGLSEKFRRMVSINYRKCIRCYCCHELCPEDAISVRRAPFSKGLSMKKAHP